MYQVKPTYDYSGFQDHFDSANTTSWNSGATAIFRNQLFETILDNLGRGSYYRHILERAVEVGLVVGAATLFTAWVLSLAGII